ncbi:MAG: tRNA (adenosine(37)-N6)-threonylcarbamoyltransferase complex ATPase subunit type 1 TsaE [Bacilli bacterium]|nr:tRNA (adenosine(37)-N6)-threonylcarbamoyltransferase complex ATPase subunit type 1 TsaE [Bacilli bacterium]
MEYKIATYNEQETIELAENIASERFPNMIICLEGDLGSGKTIFTKGIANSLGINEPITSPTFTIIKEYQGEVPLFHMDVYRLKGSVDDLGLDEYFEKNGIVVIEWADMISDHLPKERLNIRIKITGENSRVFIVKPIGRDYEDLCETAL